MSYYDIYTKTVQDKNKALRLLAKAELAHMPAVLATSCQSQNDVIALLQSTKHDGFNALYEQLQIQANYRRGRPTKVVQTPHGRAFVIHSKRLAKGELAGSQVKNHHIAENYQILALNMYKSACDFVSIYLPKSMQEKLNYELRQQFANVFALLTKHDGRPDMAKIIASYEASLIALLTDYLKKTDNPRSKKEVKKRFQQLKQWSQTSYPTHDFVVIKADRASFSITSSISAPNIKQLVDMVIIAYHHDNDMNPASASPGSIMDWLQARFDLSEALEGEVKAQLMKQAPSVSLPKWFTHIKDTKERQQIAYYAKHHIRPTLFMPLPVKLDGRSVHTTTKELYPQSVRALHAHMVGRFDKRNDNEPVVISATLRSGAPSRTGDRQNSVRNNTLIIAAGKALDHDKELAAQSRVVTTPLVTDKISYLAKLKFGYEPDKDIYAAQQHVSQLAKFSKHLSFRPLPVIAKRSTSYKTRKAYRDPYQLIDRIIHLDIETHDPVVENAYVTLQTFAKNVLPAQERQFLIDYQKTVDALTILKKYYETLPSEKLLRHILLLESTLSYIVVEANQLKKRYAGKNSDPLIYTAIEAVRYGDDKPLRHNHYDQWLFALENIIGTQMSILADVSPITSKDTFFNAITHFYCKDGRDRTGLTDMLFEQLLSMFLGSRMGSDKPRLSLIPMSTPLLQKSGQLGSFKGSVADFMAEFQTMVDDAVTSSLNSSPQSSMGNYGLLNALVHGKGPVSSAIPSALRAMVSKIGTRSADLFNKSASTDASFTDVIDPHRP